MLSYTVEEREKLSWKDALCCEIYTNVECRDMEDPEIVKPVSKKKILRNISEVNDITEDIVFLIANIYEINHIIVIKNEKQAILHTDKNEIALSDISNNFEKVIRN